MFLGHDGNWWALTIGIAALVLAVPLSIVGNLLTPILKNWWAERSVVALKKRIAVLSQELAGLEGHRGVMLSDFAHYTLLGIEYLGYGMIILMETVAAAAMMILYLRKSVPFAGIFAVLLIILILIAAFLTRSGMHRMKRFRTMHSRLYRMHLHASIIVLESKLSKMTRR